MPVLTDDDFTDADVVRPKLSGFSDADFSDDDVVKPMAREDFDPADEDQVDELVRNSGGIDPNTGVSRFREDQPGWRPPITDKKALRFLRSVSRAATVKAANAGNEDAQTLLNVDALPMKAAVASVNSSVEGLDALRPTSGQAVQPYEGPPEGTLSAAPTILGEIGKGNVGNATGIAGDLLRRQFSGLVGASESQRMEESIPVTQPDGSVAYVYKPLGDRMAQGQGLLTPAVEPYVFQPAAGDSTATAIGKAAANTVGGFAGMMMSPLGAVLPVAGEVPALARVGSGLFAADMASHLPEQLAQIRDADTPQGVAEGILGAGSTALFAAGAAGHALARGEAPGRSRLLHAGDALPHDSILDADFEAGRTPEGWQADVDRRAEETRGYYRQWKSDAPPEPLFPPAAPVRAVPVELAPAVEAADMPLTAEAIRKEPAAPAPAPAAPDSFLADIEKLANEPTPAPEAAKETPTPAGEVPSASEAPREAAAGAVPAVDLHAEAAAAGAVYQGHTPDLGLHAFKELTTGGNFSVRDADLSPETIKAKAEAVRKAMPAQEPALTTEQEAEWRAMQEEHEAEMRGDLNEAPGSHELLEAVRNLGGLPTADASLRGETQRLWEASKGRMMRLSNKAQTLSFDGLREGLEQYGFKFETAADMLDALETRISTGKEVRGFEPGGDLFASLSDRDTGPVEVGRALIDVDTPLVTDLKDIDIHPDAEAAVLVDKDGVHWYDLTGEKPEVMATAKATGDAAAVNALSDLSIPKVRRLEDVDRADFPDADKALVISPNTGRIELIDIASEEPLAAARLQPNPDLMASKAEPVFEPRLRAAYDALVKRDRFGFPAVSIGALAKESGIPLADLKAKLMALHRQGRVVLSPADWSLSSPETRAGAMDVNGQRMTQVRPLDDTLASKTPAAPETEFRQKLLAAYDRAPSEAELDAQGKRPTTVDFERPGGAGRFAVQNTKEAIAALAKKQGVTLAERKYTPALKTADGTVFTGESHPDAYAKALASNGSTRGQRGFVTADGKFISNLLDVARIEQEERSRVRASLMEAERPSTHSNLVKYAVERAAKKFGDPDLRVSIIRDESELPMDIQRRLKDPRAVHEGLVDTKTGRVFILTDNIHSAARAVEVLAHEVVGHYGVEKLVGPKEWQRIAGSIFRESAAAARNVAGRYTGEDSLFRKSGKLSDLTPAERALVAREYVARLAENPALAPRTWDRIVAAVRRALKALGIQKHWSEADIRDLLRRAAREVEAPQESAGAGVMASRLAVGGERLVGSINDDFSTRGKRVSGEMDANEDHGKLGVKGDHRFRYEDGTLSWYHWPGEDLAREAEGFARNKMGAAGEIRHTVAFPQGGPKERVLSSIHGSLKDIAPHTAVVAAFEKAVPEERREDVSRYVADTLAGRPTVKLAGREKNMADRFVRQFQDLKTAADAAGTGKQVMDVYRAALTAKPDMTLPERLATFTAQAEKAKGGAVAAPAAPEPAPAPVAGPPSSPEPPAGDGGDTTALKRAVVDLQREVQGGEEIPVPTRVDSEELIRQAGEAVSGDPGMAARIVARILSTEHHDDLAVSRRDAAVMLVERTRLRNQRAEAMGVSTNPNALPEERAAAASDIALTGQEIDRLDQASRAAGTAWSDFGRLYQQVQRSDYTVEAQTRRLESAKGAPLDEKEKAAVAADVTEIEKGEAAVKQRTEEIQAEQSRQAASDMLAGMEPPVRASRAVMDLAEKIVRKLESAADAARKRMRERLGKASAGVDPTVLYDVAVIGLSKLGRATLDFAHWSAEMVDEFDAMDFDVRPYLNEAWTKTQEMWAAEEKKMTGAQRENVRKSRVKRVDLLSDRLGIYDGIKAAAEEGAAIGGELDKFVKQLVKNYVDAGERGLDNVVGKVKGTLETIVPGITERQVMDAFSDYGKSTPATSKEADVHRAQIRREAQLTSAIADVESGVAPRATGKRRPAQSAAARQLTARLNEAKRRYNIQPLDPAAALRSALDARKTYFRNRIQDLAFEIARKERVIREKSLSTTDAELDKLKAAYEVVKADHEAVFGKREMSDEQRLQQAVKVAERNEKIAAQQLADAKKGIFPGATGGSKPGVGAAPKLVEIRARADAMRQEAAELRSHAFGLDANRREQVLKAKIEDLNGRLIAGDVSAAGAAPKAEPSVRAESLKAEYDAMRRLMADLRRDADPKRAPDAVEARKLAKLQKSIDALDQKLQTGDLSVRARRPSTDSADAEFLKAQRAAMMAHLAEMRRISRRTLVSPEERALRAYRTRLANTEADLAARNLRADAGDATAFHRNPRRPVDISSDPALVAQKVRVEEAKTNLARKQAAFEKAQRNRLEKMLEGISGWRRAFVLSGVHTLAKLTSAAGEIITIAPIEEVVGGVLGKLPFIRRASEQAPRHGGFSPRAEWEAIAETTTKLFKDAGDYMKRGATDLDSIYGKPRIEPFEFKELLGRMHGALKTPARRNEWTRSYRKRMEFAAKAGADIANPLVQTRIGLEAYEDAHRSIFMESNMVVEGYKRFLSRFAQKDESGHASVAGKIAETTARVLVPIVKIPTNLVARTFEYTFGSVTGLTRLGFALARGIDTLPPEQADIIMRNLKRGSLGAAVLAIGYLNPNSIGGYYNAASDQGDVKHGEIEIYGHSIPKVLIHNPLLEQLQIGATIRRVADSKLKKSDSDTQGISVGAQAAALGLLKEVPFLNVVNRTGEAIRNSEAFGSYAGDQIRGLVVPQGIDEAARFFDRDAAGETVKRAPKTLLERIRSSIPFYRNDLPEKRHKR